MDSSQPIWARDLPTLLTEVYLKVGANTPDNSDCLLIDLIEWLNRIPTRFPRRVHVSDTLRGKILTPYEIHGIQSLTSALESGRNIRPFLGESTVSIRNRTRRKSKMGKSNDLFFSAWGLHHFHLGADFANSGKRVMRSRRVLIAYLSEFDAYFINVASHGKGFADAWGDKSHFEIFQRNWPHVFERYELKGVMAPKQEDQFSAYEYMSLRESGVTTSVIVNGRVFLGLGLGIATDGSSIKAVKMSDRIRHELSEGEKIFREKEPSGDAMLFVAQDASVGFFVPEKNTAFSIFPGRTSLLNVTQFFSRLIEETDILREAPEGAIWTPHLG